MQFTVDFDAQCGARAVEIEDIWASRVLTAAAQTGWPLRFYIEQETVKDLRRDENPREEDWSADGQDAAKEALFQERLLRNVAPKSGPLGADVPGANRP